MSDALIQIPVIDVPMSEEPAVVSALAESRRLDELIRGARRTYTTVGVRFADARSRRWSARSTSPYAASVESVSQAVGRPGAFLLNYSYEWGCTSGAANDHLLGGTTLLRTLDWPFDGLGRALVVIRREAAPGQYLSVTWPGFVGVFTGLAPGRFAAAINQPPLPLSGLGKAAGWLAARLRVNRSDALPPDHLLRLAFETCLSFADAVSLIRRTPICLPAIFTVAGPEFGEAVVIERTESSFFEPKEPAAANHWAADPGPPGRPRNRSSVPRREAMCGMLAKCPGWSLDWLEHPIAQSETRLAVMANPRTGSLIAQGWERSGPATAVLSLG